MGGHKPVVIITDQDPAMKIAIENVFTDNNTLHTIPELKLHKDIDKHGREVYTHKNFYIFQGELWSACVDCGFEETKEDNGHLLIVILEQLMVNGNKVSKHRKVVYNPSNHIAHCSCKMFESEGMPCRHILLLLKGKVLNEIPSYYIINRWTKLATSAPIFYYDGNVLEACFKLESESKLISDAWAQLFKCMHLADTCKDKLLLVINEASSIEMKLIKMKGDVGPSKLNELESFVGSTVPEKVDILPPQPSNTKGCGKQIKGGKEKAMEQQQKENKTL
ncbi:Zinc finger, PMZ-type [Sesbania bispinosa]|nr:Zinc finger, PMZ-type [Sesbania bispinosa]